jgi:hypothetical protein
MLTAVMLSVIYAEYGYAECWNKPIMLSVIYAECRYAECL